MPRKKCEVCGKGTVQHYWDKEKERHVFAHKKCRSGKSKRGEGW